MERHRGKYARRIIIVSFFLAFLGFGRLYAGVSGVREYYQVRRMQRIAALATDRVPTVLAVYALFVGTFHHITGETQMVLGVFLLLLAVCLLLRCTWARKVAVFTCYGLMLDVVWSQLVGVYDLLYCTPGFSTEHKSSLILEFGVISTLICVGMFTLVLLLLHSTKLRDAFSCANR